MTLFDADPEAKPSFVRATVTDVRTVVLDVTVHPADDVDAEVLAAAKEAFADPSARLLHRSTTIVLMEPGLPLGLVEGAAD